MRTPTGGVKAGDRVPAASHRDSRPSVPKRTLIIGGSILVSLFVPSRSLGDDRVIPLWDSLRERRPGSASIEPPHPAAINLGIVATIQRVPLHQMTFGDTDHDGNSEAIIIDYDPTPPFEGHYLVLEHRGKNTYSSEYRGEYLIPNAVADLDGDGKSDLVGQVGGRTRVYESVDASSHPSQLVWQSPQLSNVLNIEAVGDTDRDGRMEILRSSNPFTSGTTYLHIYENVGDNDYKEVYVSGVRGGVATKIIADFDRDGFTEIGLIANRVVYFYESTANDEWHITWSDSTPFDGSDARGGIDTDGNGRLELFVMGNSPLGWTTRIYEAVCNDFFVQVAGFADDDGASGNPRIALAYLDGPSAPASYLVRGYRGMWIHRATGVGRWERIGEIRSPDFVHAGLYGIDVNQNGRDEVFWTAEQTPTFILESSPTPDDVAEQPPASRFVVAPNPARGAICIGLTPDLAQRARFLAVYDVAGRTVARWGIDARSSACTSNLPRDIATGNYLVTVEDAQRRALARARTTIIR